jgi:hypothetical protein
MTLILCALCGETECDCLSRFCVGEPLTLDLETGEVTRRCRELAADGGVTLTVTKVDRERGIVEVSAARRLN